MAQGNFTTKNKALSLTEAKKLLSDERLKNPFNQSSNPFKDGEILKFSGFVRTDWDNGTKKGFYLSIGFEGTDRTISLSVFNRHAFGFKKPDMQGEPEKIENEGGLHELTKEFTVLTEKEFNAIHKWLKDSGELKVVLTTYFTDFYGKASDHTLTNLHKA